ncbi:MAG: type 1 glutamine amidotransferase [Actinobacteria bacterium]|nr:type 1 glutamine amidotransferase [Actinomycetota bacterium]
MSERPPIVVALQNAANCPVNLVGQWITQAGLEVRTLHLYAKQPFPHDVAELKKSLAGSPLAGIISLGGSISADDDDVAPWLIGERALLADAISLGVPVLGLCLGAQLLALSTGGSVDLAELPEIGVHAVTIKDSADEVFGALASSEQLPTIQWHQDEVRHLPPGATSIAKSSSCRNQIYRMGRLQYGLQFHPEADPTIVRMWEKHGDDAYQRSGRSVEGLGQIEREVHQSIDQIKSVWSEPIKRWAELASQPLETQLEQPSQHR